MSDIAADEVRACEACMFWVPGTDVDEYVRFGQCRRNPPVVVPGKKAWRSDRDQLWPVADFPLTPSGAWCGEFSAGSWRTNGRPINRPTPSKETT